VLRDQIEISAEEFGLKFKASPVKRAGHAGFVRSAIVAAGNVGGQELLPVLRAIEARGDALAADHAAWAAGRIRERENGRAKIDGSYE
jgi:epoxyqueuosine reductase QueG